MVEGAEWLMRWPSGEVSPLILLGRDHYVDRSYWEEIKIERDTAGFPVAIVYDRFKGNAASAGAK